MSGAPALDEQTQRAVRDVIAAASAGRTDEAIKIGEGALAGGADVIALNALLGTVRCSAGRLAEGIQNLTLAHQARQNDPVIALNLSSALAALEDHEAVMSIATADLASADRTLRLARIRGFAAQMLEDHGAAEAAYRLVLTADPKDWETWNNLGNSRVAAGDLPGGIGALRSAARLNPAAALTRINLARALRDAGDFAGAESELRGLASDVPEDPRPFGDLFGLLQMQGWDTEAEAALCEAILRDPDNPELHIALGRQQLLRFAMAEAVASFRRVLELDGANGDAFLGIADALEHSDASGLPGLVAEARTAQVDDARLSLITAMLARAERRYAEGLLALEAVPADFDPIRRWHLAGQLFDAAGEFDSAFAAFERMNLAMAEEPTRPVARAAELRQRIRERLRLTTPEWRDSWVAGPVGSERPAPVFLVGFPRSGTTLLDTMLMGHPAVEVMEERPVIAQIRSETSDFDAVPSMDEAEVRRLQDRYFQLAGAYTELKPGSVLVDKSPLHMQSVPLIHRLFPDARFILALRHPLDVVLSCFITKFRPNSSMANFLQLDVAAEFYDLTFTLWEQARQLFPVQVDTVVYERLIQEPESQLKPVVEAIGLDWKPEVADHQVSARSRGIITTASYAQVTQPLYSGAVGRWHNYRKQLEPVLPVLAPWVEKLGYSLEV